MDRNTNLVKALDKDFAERLGNLTDKEFGIFVGKLVEAGELPALPTEANYSG